MQLEYRILNGETLQDVVMNTYHNLEYQNKLVLDNPTVLTSLDVNMNTVSGKVIYYDYDLSQQRAEEVNTSVPIDLGTVKTFVGKEGQSIYDASIQTHGGLENIVKMSFDNGYSLEDGNGIKNKEFNYNTKDISNILLVNWLSDLGTSAGSYVIELNRPHHSYDNSFDYSFD